MASRHLSDKGFTLVEMIVVILILGILAALTLPNYFSLRTRSRAAGVLEEMRTIEVAVFDYDAAAGLWPDGGEAGSTPASIAANLPGSFSFEGTDYNLVYSNTSDADNTDLRVGVQTSNIALGETVLSLAGRARTVERSGTYWMLIASDLLGNNSGSGEAAGGGDDNGNGGGNGNGNNGNGQGNGGSSGAGGNGGGSSGGSNSSGNWGGLSGCG